MLNFKIPHFLIFLILFPPDGFLYGQIVDTSFLKNAEAIFTKVEHLCMKDDGGLWGENLYCPLVIVQRNTRAMACNCKYPFPTALPYGNIYYGCLDDSVIVAGSAYSINGTVCAMLPYELATDTTNWQAFLHEIFHAFQRSKGMKYDYDNTHLERPDARVHGQLGAAVEGDHCGRKGRGHVREQGERPGAEHPRRVELQLREPEPGEEHI